MLGGGQLGRMFALAARPMGYRVHVYAPEAVSPAGQVSDQWTRAAYEDEERFETFLDGVDVLTYEFENVPLDAVDRALERGLPVRPGRKVLETAQDRLKEKELFHRLGLETAPFDLVHAERDLQAAVAKVGFPSVLKATRFGYDGKGQVSIQSLDDVGAAWRHVAPGPALLERWIDFEREISVVAARGFNGKVAFYPLVENRHVNHILDTTLAPATVSSDIIERAETAVNSLLEALEVVGLICVEFFLDREGNLLANEIAPRPHNSGHWTIEGAVTSQFAQQVRTVCGLPVGSTEQKRAAVMVNLLGDLWQKGTPRWSQIFEIPECTLHLYGKDEHRPGRKMGHITATGESVTEAERRALAARGAI